VRPVFTFRLRRGFFPGMAALVRRTAKRVDSARPLPPMSMGSNTGGEEGL